VATARTAGEAGILAGRRGFEDSAPATQEEKLLISLVLEFHFGNGRVETPFERDLAACYSNACRLH
jgi:hypothetical protein